MKQKIDFIGIGVKKCGSTWVTACLNEHPQICCSNPKETHYFSQKYHLGQDWFKSCFSHCKNQDETILGEFSPEYLDNNDALNKILNDYPETKLILILRDPIDRLISVWKFNYLRGSHTIKNVNEYLQPINSNKQIFRGLYGKHISNLLSKFNIEKLHIIIYEDIKNNPESVARDLYDFLEVDQNFIPKMLRDKINASNNLSVRFLWLSNMQHKMIRNIKSLSFYKKIHPYALKLRINKISNYIFKVNQTSKNTVSKHSLVDVININNFETLKQYYSEDVKFIESLTGRSLDKLWLNNHE